MLSVVLVTYNMRREAARTLFSLAAPYQRRIGAADYEVIVVDNGSSEPLGADFVERFGPGFRYYFRETTSPSPASAMNFGVLQARHENIGLLVDGARIASPGLLHFALCALALAERPLVATLAWHLGPQHQWLSMARGYDRDAEDELLERCGWMEDGYRLIGISTLAGSSTEGYFRAPAESNALFLPRSLYEELGGFDERFSSPGGGFVNGDFFVRACEAPGTELIMLLSEGTFHQTHGGASTNILGKERAHRMRAYSEEYQTLRGRPFVAPRKEAMLLGTMPVAGRPVLEHSISRLVPSEDAQRTPATVPIVFCIDCEPNEHAPERFKGEGWSHMEECFERLAGCRSRLAEATGTTAALNWMVRADPQLEEVHGDSGFGLSQYADAWQALSASGDEVGLHPHPQRWSGDQSRWSGGQESVGWAEHVLQVAYEDFRRVLGRAPRTLRYGNRFMSQAVAMRAEKLGFQYELTIEPGYPGRDARSPTYPLAGHCPSYFEAPREPYRSATHDFLLPDPSRTQGMWHLPVSTAPVIEGAPRSRAPYHRAVSPELNQYETLHLRLDPALFKTAVNHLLHELGRPYLLVVIRCDMISEPNVWANIDVLCSHSWVSHFVFTTPADALEILGYERNRRI